MSRALETSISPAHRAAAAHHSRTTQKPDRVLRSALLAAALVALGACGTVDVAPSAKDGAGGNGAAGAGAPDGAAGGGGSFSAAGGAGGATVAAAGSSGGAELGGRGGASSSSDGGTGSAGPDPRTAPACKYTSSGGTHFEDCHTSDGGYVEVTVNGGVPGSGINSWRCRTACASEPVVPCAGSNAVYCVATCADCY